jgi:uncharacterized phage infection (PIP) family protein YhgE
MVVTLKTLQNKRRMLEIKLGFLLLGLFTSPLLTWLFVYFAHYTYNVDFYFCFSFFFIVGLLGLPWLFIEQIQKTGSKISGLPS